MTLPPQDVLRYIDTEPFRFDLRVGQGQMGAFFAKTTDHEMILSERNAILKACPARHAALLPEGQPLLDEAAEMMGALGGTNASGPLTIISVGSVCEPDFLLLQREPEGPRLAGGCVCFPSAWDLREKIGRRMTEIHSVVPRLNDTLAKPIDVFLDRIKPGRTWTRTNWGLSRWPNLNQHPALMLPRLDGSATLEQTYFRLEEQTLAALPRANGILFGIRIKVLALEEFDSEAAARLALKLRTMPEDVARYKGLLQAREKIASLLEKL